MDAARLRELRAGKQVPIATLAKVIGKSIVSYGKKERGEVNFKPSEVIALAKFYELSWDDLNAIFYDNKLPIGNYEDFYKILAALGIS